MPTPKTKYLEVQWLDAWSNHDKYYEGTEFMKERGLLTVSVGRLVASTPQGVTIAMTDTPTETYKLRHVLFVPRAMIVKIRTLK